jgi:MinD-like ATPase involved in chromosome partitioning or flagellar assembly/tetratricopeptide (TPR) repeat protein
LFWQRQEQRDMYVTTFYSFKGGVGRTFALVNVAIELARTGRNVLLVDFDLEAPVIHTFAALSPQAPHPGVVEYVSDYIATGVAPDVKGYVYERPDAGDRGGRVWIMPAGRGDHEYRSRLSSINWKTLYSELDGFLFFEDLKAQWKESFRPDYVLIDSRTGHTDVEGICTRQLPDAVVVLFFPNEQNLCGLREVVNDIHSEATRTRKNAEPITLHFVMSNIPDLDDEDGILRDRLREFRRTLKYDSLSVIHNYPSLALLNQGIFTRDRPKSRLAREYRRLTDQIVDENDEDVEGVVRFLKQFEMPHFQIAGRRLVDVDKRLRSIEKNHGEHGEAMFLLGMVRKSQGDLAAAIDLFNRALEHGYRETSVFVERATCHAMRGDRDRMAEELERVIGSPDLRDYELHRVVQLLGRDDERLLAQVVESPVLRDADADTKWMIAIRMCESGGGASAGKLLEEVIDDPRVSNAVRRSARSELMLALMGQSDIATAMKVMGQERPAPDDLDIQDAFNYAMAEWAQSGVPPRDLFDRVVQLEGAENQQPRANFQQCLAVSYWAVGETEKAKERLENALEKARQIRKTEFSCWRYQEASQDEFIEDCKEIGELIRVGKGRPRFFPSERQPAG